MRLTKKHINQLFTVGDPDGSWAYHLVDVKNGKLLFYDVGSGDFLIESQFTDDWIPYQPLIGWTSISKAWKRAKYVDGKLVTKGK